MRPRDSRQFRRCPEHLTVASLCIGALLAVGCGGCGGETRSPRSSAQLLAARAESDATAQAQARALTSRLLQRTKREYDQYLAKTRSTPPVVDILIISGGGDWGAFGAGFLKGWGRIPANKPLARPHFSVVTGVSTGAIIAPFAFLEDEESIDLVEHLYRNPQSDWVKLRGWLYFLPSNISLAEVPGLERELRKALTAQVIGKIADAGADGRLLAVNTTNVDDESPRVFDLVAEAQRARQSGNLDRIHNVVLASAGIPAIFPFRMIDNQMYVDGGVSGNILYGGRQSENESFAPQWLQEYPSLPIPKIRYWIIFNNEFRPPPQVTEPRWPAVIGASTTMSTRAATLTAIRHLFAMADVAKLKWHADVEVRIAAVPDDWTPPKPGAFVKETMNALADLGERMGADSASWLQTPP